MHLACMPAVHRQASLAQSVERFTRNEKVAGSIPAGGSHKRFVAVPRLVRPRTFNVFSAYGLGGV